MRVHAVAVCVLLVALFTAGVRADESGDDDWCADGIQNGNETGIDCGGDDCIDCSYDDQPEDDEDSGFSWDPTGDDDLTRSDENTVGGIVGSVAGVFAGSIVFGWILPKLCKTKKQGSEGCWTTLLLGVSVIFLLVGSSTDAWCTWDVTTTDDGHLHFVASPFGLCENHQSGDCLYVDQQCDVSDEDGDDVLFGYPTLVDTMPGNCNELRTVQAFTILTCLIGIGAWLLSHLTGAKPNTKNPVVFLSALTAGFGLLAMAVWADYRDSDQGWFAAYNDDGQESEWYYDWSFFCFITGWVTAAIAAIVACFIEPTPAGYNAPGTKA